MVSHGQLGLQGGSTVVFYLEVPGTYLLAITGLLILSTTSSEWDKGPLFQAALLWAWPN